MRTHYACIIHIGPEYRLIVEETPRIRALMAAKGIDWSTEALKSDLIRA